MTAAQQRLMDAIENAAGEPVRVRGAQLRTAQALSRRGLIELQLQGSPWTSPWWWEVTRKEK